MTIVFGSAKLENITSTKLINLYKTAYELTNNDDERA